MTGMRAVVTGAGRGLGAVIVQRLREADYEVVATDIAGADIVLDVTDAQACHALAREVDPAVWVNNAGVLLAGDAATQPQQDVEQMIAVNLLGAINGSRAAVASMRGRSEGRGAGHVISIGSLASWVPVPGEAVYAATKAGLLSFTLAMRAELVGQGVKGIRFSVICPDGMLTPMILEDLDNEDLALTFTGLRMVEPSEVADRVMALLQRPRLVSSVPRWRGGMVRVLGAIPDFVLPLNGAFGSLGEANRRRIAAKVRARAG